MFATNSLLQKKKKKVAAVHFSCPCITPINTTYLSNKTNMTVSGMCWKMTNINNSSRLISVNYSLSRVNDPSSIKTVFLQYCYDYCHKSPHTKNQISVKTLFRKEARRQILLRLSSSRLNHTVIFGQVLCSLLFYSNKLYYTLLNLPVPYSILPHCPSW